MKSHKGFKSNTGRMIIFLLMLFFLGGTTFLYLGDEYKASEGVNTENFKNAIYIHTEEELIDFATDVNSGNPYVDMRVILTEDLDMGGVENFIPIGVYDGGSYFRGIFDGNGHVIRNLNIITTEGSGNNGLFGVLSGTICNLTMEDCYVTGNASGVFCSIAGSNGAKIYNCVARGVTVDALYTNVFGGQYFGELENCVIDGYVSENAIDTAVWEIENVDFDAYNERLERLSGNCKNVPLCRMNDDGSLDYDNRVTTCKMYVHLDSSSYKGDIKPCYIDGIYYFILPGKELQGTATLHVPGDSRESYEIKEPGDGSYETDVKLEDNQYTVKVCYAKDTPAVFVDYNDTDMLDYLKSSKEHISSGDVIQVLDETGKVNYVGRLERMQSRGNDSWFEPKKGFNLNLMEDANLLGMGYEKDYALIPGYRRASLLTYKVVADLSNEMELEYAPEYHFVNFYADGEYQGMYVLAEKMNVGYNRINIDATGRDVTGGYLYEMDNVDYEGEINTVKTDQDRIYVIKDPLIVRNDQLEYSRILWDSFEKALFSEDGYNEEGRYYGDYIDIDSLAKLWLFYEINAEYSIYSSVYFYKDADSRGDGKIHALYPWDVEHSFTKETYMTTSMMPIAEDIWTEAYRYEDFREAVYKNWIEIFRPALCKLLDESTGYNENGLSYIGIYGVKYEVSSRWNELLWGDEQNMLAKGESIRQWLEARIPYLDESLEIEKY